MRKMILYIATSLDGKIAKKDGSIDWLTIFEFTPELQQNYDDLLSRIDTSIMGYQTYDQIKDFEPFPYPQLQNYVFTKTKTKLSQAKEQAKHHSSVELCYSDSEEMLINQVKSLKSEENRKDIFLIGGSQIITPLLNAHLIDEIIITYIPVYLADEGIPLFKAHSDLMLKPIKDAQLFNLKFNEQTYQLIQMTLKA
jgi:dihydrofolate reductase